MRDGAGGRREEERLLRGEKGGELCLVMRVFRYDKVKNDKSSMHFLSG